MTSTILDESKLLPSTTRHSFSLPLGLCDLWHYQVAVRSLIFFKSPSCTKSHFMNKIVPDLKRSLSLTLAHFLPFAGNIIHPLNTGDKPILRYESGDSLSLIVSESDTDFNDLTGDHPRLCHDFYAFVPNPSPVTHSEKMIACPVLALQVTLFPGQGISIGNLLNHVVCDANTYVRFMLAWALINRSMHECGEGVDNILTEANYLPFFNRKTDVIDPNGLLFSIFWKRICGLGLGPEPLPLKLPIHNHRATFVLKKEVIQKLKEFVSKDDDFAHPSSFTVICALIWVCNAKSTPDHLQGVEVADDEPEYFCIPADIRARLDPPLPANYFGNCYVIARAKLTHGEVKGRDGLMVAAKAIAEAIKEKVYSDKGVLHGADKVQEKLDEMIGKRQYWVGGSPRYDFYEVDFGWGEKPNKYELLNTDKGDGGTICISLSKSRDFEGGSEFGISMTMAQMNAFTKVFSQLVNNLFK